MINSHYFSLSMLKYKCLKSKRNVCVTFLPSKLAHESTWWWIKQAVFARHSMADAPMSSQSLWQHALKPKPMLDKIPQRTREGRHKVHTLAEEPLAFDFCLEKVTFLHWSDTGYINHAPMLFPCPSVIWPTQSGVDGSA